MDGKVYQYYYYYTYVQVRFNGSMDGMLGFNKDIFFLKIFCSIV